MEPDDGTAAALDEIGERRRRRTAVADERDRRAMGDEGRREEREIGLVERLPIAAVEERHQRRDRVAHPEDVEALRRIRAIGEIGHNVVRGTGGIGRVAPALRVMDERRRRRARIELRVERRLVEVAVNWHGRSMAQRHRQGQRPTDYEGRAMELASRLTRWMKSGSPCPIECS
jgi:hypothetical protein